MPTVVPHYHQGQPFLGNAPASSAHPFSQHTLLHTSLPSEAVLDQEAPLLSRNLALPQTMHTAKASVAKDTIKLALLASFYLLWFIGWSLLVYLYQVAS